MTYKSLATAHEASVAVTDEGANLFYITAGSESNACLFGQNMGLGS